MSPDLESEMMETTTENRRRRGYVKKRVKTARRMTTELPGLPSSHSSRLYIFMQKHRQMTTGTLLRMSSLTTRTISWRTNSWTRSSLWL